MISTKGRYAVRVMIDLASNDQGHFIPLKDMVAGGLVTGASGKGGGYKLSRRPEDYRLDEILEIMEGPLAPVACLSGEKNECPRREQCRTLPLWTEFDTLVHSFLHGKRLSDLI